MKKTTFVLTLTLVALLVLGVGTASAEDTTTNGPHGNYTHETDGCSACHETHAADGSSLFKYTISEGGNQCYKTCTYCHGPSSIHSIYDAVGGQIAGTHSASGNGFMTASNGNTITSKHDVDGLVALKADGGPTSGGAFAEFSCSNCHSPHGSASDRLLVTSVDSVDTDGVTKKTWTVNKPFKVSIANKRTNEAVTYVEGVNDFCGLCHTDYNSESVGTGSGDKKSGYYDGEKYRHAMGVDVTTAKAYTANDLPIEVGASGTAKNLVCLSCHFAHGTDKTATKTYSAGQSALLRKNDRGVCIACHDWSTTY